MKLNIFVSLVFFLFTTLFLLHTAEAQQSRSQQISAVKTEENHLSFRLEFNIPDLVIAKSPEGNFIRIKSGDLYPSGEVGGPELAVFRKMLELPYRGDWSIEYEIEAVKHFDLSTDFPGLMLYPRQAPYCKHPDSIAVFEFNPAAYELVAEVNERKVLIEDIGFMRNKHLGVLEFNPFTYNAVGGTLDFVYRLQIHITFNNVSELDENTFKARYSPFFLVPESELIGGITGSRFTDDLNTRPITYVIVSHPMFEDSLQGFISWKERKGFKIIEAYTNDPLVGNTTTSIRNYLLGLYQNANLDNPAPTYLLLVGDVGQIPAFSGTTGSHYSDLKYAEYSGDNLPELYYGRFSANNINELMPQIEKTLEYEQYLMADPSYLNDVVMIAGADATYGPTHANGQINYGTTYYFNLSNGINSSTYLYPASASSDLQIRNKISNGVSYANYTAHGGTGGWVDPTFNSSQVAAMTNDGKYPLMVGNACLTNSFQINACFGETLLRASHKGAIGYIGASDNTYWDEDFYWGVGLSTVSATPTYNGSGPGAYDRLWHTHGESYNDWYITQGQMIHSGNLAVETSSSSLKKYYWEVYHLMGDPSLMVYLGQPPLLSLNVPSLISPTATSIDITTEPYAYIALSLNGILHGAGLADSSGIAHISLNPFQVPGTAEIVGTRQNRQPFFGSFPVVAPSGAYPFLDNIFTLDTAGNSNGLAEYGERVHLSVILTNAGTASADSVEMLLHCNDPFVIIEDDQDMMYTLSGGATDTLNAAFCLRIATDVADQYVAQYTVELRFPGDTLIYSRQITLNSPKLSVNAYSIIELSGNGNGLAEAGENAYVQLDLRNEGHAESLHLKSSLKAISPFVIIPDSIISDASLAAGQQLQVNLPLLVSNSCPQGYTIILQLLVQADSGIILIDTLSFNAGYPPVAIIDLDPNHSSASAISQSIESNGLSIDEFTSMPADLTMYRAVFVTLGVYSNNHVLSSSEGTVLAAYLNNGGNLYMEGGDTWAYDTITDVHPLFNIDGLSDGNSDLTTLGGKSGTFSSPYSFVYNGENNWIDHLSPLGTAFAIFDNASPSYTAAVAFDSVTYRTIGCSFEFSGLVNASSPNTRNELMHTYLEFFGLAGGQLIPGFIASDTNVCIDSLLTLSDTSAGGVTAWFWKMEGADVPWSELQHPQISYPVAGSYDITLAVSDGIHSEVLFMPAIVNVDAKAILQNSPSDTSLGIGNIAVFSASATTYAYCRWEMSTDAGLSWNPLVNDSIFSGAESETLSVSITNTQLDGAYFHCNYYAHCDALTISQAAMLTIDNSGIYGKTYYQNSDSTALQNVLVSAQGTTPKSTHSNLNGWYEMDLNAGGQYTLQTNVALNWGGVNATDALLILRHFVSFDTLQNLALKAGDVDGSGYLNATDALLSSQRFVGFASSFPAGDWVSEDISLYYDGTTAVHRDIAFLCTGDVDQTYSTPQKTHGFIQQNAILSASTGDRLSIPLRIGTDEVVGALSIILDWPRGLSVENIHTGSGQALLNYKLSANELRISWCSLEAYDPQTSLEPLLWIDVVVNKLQGDDEINLQYLEVANERANTISKATVILPAISFMPVIQFGKPYPVPSRSIIYWPFNASTSLDAQFEVFDILGKKVYEMNAHLLQEAGAMKLGLNLDPGIYFIRFVANINGIQVSDKERVVISY